jgi:uncharacterized membrane protein
MIIILRLIHILSAVFWVGTLLFTAFYLFPALRVIGPAAGPVMAGLQKRGFLIALPVSGLVTLLSGVALIWVVSGGNMSAYSRTSTGRMFTMAGGLAVIAFFLGIAISRPAGGKLMKLTPEMATMPEGPARTAIQTQIAALQQRVGISTMVISILVIIAAAGMAVARYM